MTGKFGSDNGPSLAPDSLVEHDLFGKPASTLGTSPRAGFFRIMLYTRRSGIDQASPAPMPVKTATVRKAARKAWPIST